ncbi:hypothetical protein OGAPHI_003125 [Ogataea philodendri]|uniref:Uncharacterized protein n=1 Tax=Ogataea philodendri TaxID=1378263 RepID=A0A9P8T706_9ASCO|nr:uncharacterized protein OGAPHI_003125 [Ogataea philodendri]KAH3667476.1 hypothetical protein OGAPHI_003125 [Ogataea philodendri]
MNRVLLFGLLGVVNAFENTAPLVVSSLDFKTLFSPFEYLVSSEKLADVTQLTEHLCVNKPDETVLYVQVNGLSSGDLKRSVGSGLGEAVSVAPHVVYQSIKDVSLAISPQCSTYKVDSLNNDWVDQLSRPGVVQMAIDAEDLKSVEETAAVLGVSNVIIQGVPAFESADSLVKSAKNYVKKLTHTKRDQIVDEEDYESLQEQLDQAFEEINEMIQDETATILEEAAEQASQGSSYSTSTPFVAPDGSLFENGHQQHDPCGRVGAQLHWLDRQVSCLQTVGEGHPRQVAECQHKPEPVCGDVHHGNYTFLVEHAVKDVERLQCHDNQQRVAHRAHFQVLFLYAGEVDQQPQQHSWSELAKELDVPRTNSRVQLAADEPVEQRVLRVATLGKNALVRAGAVRSSEGQERADVDECAHKQRELPRHKEQREKVVVHELQLRDAATRVPGPCSEHRTEQQTQFPAIDQIGQISTVSQLGASFGEPGHHEVEDGESKEPDDVCEPHLLVEERLPGQIVADQHVHCLELDINTSNNVRVVAAEVQKQHHKRQRDCEHERAGKPKEVLLDGDGVKHWQRRRVLV